MFKWLEPKTRAKGGKRTNREAVTEVEPGEAVDEFEKVIAYPGTHYACTALGITRGGRQYYLDSQGSWRPCVREHG